MRPWLVPAAMLTLLLPGSSPARAQSAPLWAASARREPALLMSGSEVYTAAEIILGELRDVTFSRDPDSTYGYRELVPRRR